MTGIQKGLNRETGQNTFFMVFSPETVRTLLGCKPGKSGRMGVPSRRILSGPRPAGCRSQKQKADKNFEKGRGMHTEQRPRLQIFHLHAQRMIGEVGGQHLGKVGRDPVGDGLGIHLADLDGHEASRIVRQ